MRNTVIDKNTVFAEWKLGNFKNPDIKKVPRLVIRNNTRRPVLILRIELYTMHDRQTCIYPETGHDIVYPNKELVIETPRDLFELFASKSLSFSDEEIRLSVDTLDNGSLDAGTGILMGDVAE